MNTLNYTRGGMMGFNLKIKKHEQSEIDEILYESAEALKNLLETQTRPPDDDLAVEWREATYRGRIALRVIMAYIQRFNKTHWGMED